MSYVSVSYILQAKEGFRLNPTFSNATGIIAGLIFFAVFMNRVKKEKSNIEKTEKAI